MRQVFVAMGSVKGYIHLMKLLDDVTGHPQRESIEKRIEIIKFFDEFGEDLFCLRKYFGNSPI